MRQWKMNLPASAKPCSQYLRWNWVGNFAAQSLNEDTVYRCHGRGRPFQVCSAVERSPDSAGMKMFFACWIGSAERVRPKKEKTSSAFHLQTFGKLPGVIAAVKFTLQATHTHVRAHTPTQTKGIDRYIPLVMAEVKRVNDVWEGRQSSFNRWAFKLKHQNIFLVSP